MGPYCVNDRNCVFFITIGTMLKVATTAAIAVLLAGCAGEAKESDGWNMARVEA
jgi:hypothetical protein